MISQVYRRHCDFGLVASTPVDTRNLLTHTLTPFDCVHSRCSMLTSLEISFFPPHLCFPLISIGVEQRLFEYF